MRWLVMLVTITFFEGSYVFWREMCPNPSISKDRILLRYPISVWSTFFVSFFSLRGSESAWLPCMGSSFRLTSVRKGDVGGEIYNWRDSFGIPQTPHRVFLSWWSFNGGCVGTSLPPRHVRHLSSVEVGPRAHQANKMNKYEKWVKNMMG